MQTYFVTRYDARAKVVDVTTYRAKNLDNLRKRLMKDIDLNKYYVRIGKQTNGTIRTLGEFYNQWNKPVYKSFKTRAKYGVSSDGRTYGMID